MSGDEMSCDEMSGSPFRTLISNANGSYMSFIRVLVLEIDLNKGVTKNYQATGSGRFFLPGQRGHDFFAPSAQRGHDFFRSSA